MHAHALAPLALGLLAAAGGPASAATLRPAVTLTDAVVRLSDLFDSAGAQASRVLGPGPAPGGRIVVEAPQLLAIARQFGVDWRPNSPGDRAVLDRAGRVLRLEEAIGALRPALVQSGATASSDIELSGFSPPLLPAEAKGTPIVEQLSFDPGSGKFTALLATDAVGETIRTRVAGRLQEMVQVPVPTRRLPAGTIVRAEDIHAARVPAALVGADMVTQDTQVLGMQIQHQAIAGQPLPLADLLRPPLVLKNGPVTMLLESGALSLTARGIAMDPGAPGQQIRVLNPVSHAVVQAEVTGPNQVRIIPDTDPLVPASGATAAVQP